MKRLILPLLLMLLLSSADLHAQLRGYPFAPRLNSLRIGLEGGVGVLGGDLTRESQNYHFRPIGNLEFGYVFHRLAALGAYGGGGVLRSTMEEYESNTDFYQAGMLLELRIPALRGSVFPIFQLRGGAVNIRPDQRIGRETYEFPASWHFAYSGAAGVEVISWRRLGLRALFGVTYTTTDDWDMITRGEDNDGYSWATLSMQYYFILRR
ncbi:MAG: hypothetical protein RRA94_03285 [Bacteroidota bacterium]|nr:hypothetical protein [Bacteroidota bacterium]